MDPQKIALCATCIVDQYLPEVGISTTRVLEKLGYQVEFPVEQTCCGQPFYNSGFVPEAKALAKRLIKIFEEHPIVVLPSGSCTSMIRVEYLHLLEDDDEWLLRARALAEKTYEFGEFITKFAKLPEIKEDEQTTVTYHDSCHMCRSLNLREEPRGLLQRMGYQIVEMKEPDRCCGFGGLFSARMPYISQAITQEKLDQAAQTKGDVLVTSDPGCLLQMRNMQNRDDKLQIEHIASVLEKKLV